MEETKQIPSLVKIAAALALLMLTILLPVNDQGNAQVSQAVIGNANETGVKESLPANLLAALSFAHGNYESLINQEGLLSDLQATDIVLIGEAHWDQRDMSTAFEITRLLTQKRRIALAVERFPLTLQPSLVALNKIDREELREEAIKRILQTDDYRTVWGVNHVDHAGFPNPDDPFYPLNSPSAEAFEAMMLWAARARIPIIGLDLPLSKRALGLGEDISYRNELWKNQIVNFLENNQSEDYLVVAIGGIDHFSNAPDSVQEKLRKNPSTLQLLSVGQRNANYPSKMSRQVESLALNYQINDLIIRNPQFAVVRQNINATFPTPPDYWIAVHAVDSWEK